MSAVVSLNNTGAVNWLDYRDSQGASENGILLSRAPKSIEQEMTRQIKQRALAASFGTKADRAAGTSNFSNNLFPASSMERPLAERPGNEPRMRRKTEGDPSATTVSASSSPKITTGTNDIVPQITGHGVQGGWGAASDATPDTPLLSPSEFTHQVVVPRISDRTKKIDLQVCHSAEGRYPLAQIVANMTGIPTIGYKGEMRAMSNADKIFNSKLFFPEEGGKAKKTIEAAERQFMEKQNASGNNNVMSMMLMCLPCRSGNNQIEESDSNNTFQHGPVEGRRIPGSTSRDSPGVFSDAPSSSRGAARIDNLLNVGASGSESVQRERLRNAFLEIMNDQYGRLLVDEIEPAVLDKRIRFNFLDNSLGNHMDVSDAGSHHAIVNINFQNDNVGQNSSALRNALRQALDIANGVDIVPKEDL